MPTLMGSAAAFAHSGRMTQLPTPVASAVLAKAKLERKRRRLSRLWSLDIELDLFSRNQASRPELDARKRQNEHEDVGYDRRDDPRQSGGQCPDHTGSDHRPRERSDTTDHHGHEALNQEAEAKIGEQRKHRYDQRAGKARQRSSKGKGRAVDRVGRNSRRARERRVLQ